LFRYLYSIIKSGKCTFFKNLIVFLVVFHYADTYTHTYIIYIKKKKVANHIIRCVCCGHGLWCCYYSHSSVIFFFLARGPDVGVLLVHLFGALRSHCFLFSSMSFSVSVFYLDCDRTASKYKKGIIFFKWPADYLKSLNYTFHHVTNACSSKCILGLILPFIAELACKANAQNFCKNPRTSVGQYSSSSSGKCRSLV